MLAILTASNFHRYEKFMAQALAEESVRRFLAHGGWRGQLTSAPDSDWEKLILISDRALGKFVFDRSAMLEVQMSLFVLGDEKRVVAGRAMNEMLNHIIRYRNFNVLASKVMTTNKASMQSSTRILGEPWGNEPDAAWDEVEGKLVDVAHFSRPLKYVLREFILDADDLEKMKLGRGTLRRDVDLPLGDSGLTLHVPAAHVVENYRLFNSFPTDMPISAAPLAEMPSAGDHPMRLNLLEAPLRK